ncbi:DUF6970 domain-containing protein [Pontibacter actiniarum]|uniref:DUF6970 domain-containing protein n=1 Tax=Pontibacter actiniarum TaxID=323450 RepID=A0A1X9YVT2_9BACT|nr:hypothetical protein [Pontibacter actiniarum]ARS37026.1 hypothetical protein CA264_17210 [Pontibacter actiniarum]
MNKEQQAPSFRSSLWAVAFSACLAVAGCKPADTTASTATAAQAHPDWLTKLIGELELEMPANPPARIYSYTYNGQQVYFLTGRCCDVPSKLYDAQGNVLCEPDGGITGRGDGRCTDFFEQRQNETIVWEDKRKS